MDRFKKENDKRIKHVLVAGGRLQGTEIIYLAKKAGCYVTLIDRAEDAPASGLADRVITADVFDEARVSEVFREADCVFPAIEDTEVLKQIGRYCRKAGTRYIFDEEAYHISSSKQRSNQMMRELGVPVPGDFPQCGYPVICKPDASSGSRGVLLIRTEEEFRRLPERDVKHAVIQQYLSGPVYSLEVLGNGRETIVPMITEVVVDRGYDCKRIVAPAALEDERAEEFRAIAEKINSRLHIRGLFDIEAILHDGRWYVLEIDARFPSQTPISVFCSSGINYVEFLAGSAGAGDAEKAGAAAAQFCIYQQIRVEGGSVEVCGEHIMSDAGRLRLLPGFCGADEMITDYSEGNSVWKAIVILTGKTMQDVEQKWQNCLEQIAALQMCGRITVTEG